MNVRFLVGKILFPIYIRCWIIFALTCLYGMVTMESGVAEGTSGIVCASDNGGETLLECFHVANSISLFIVILRILN